MYLLWIRNSFRIVTTYSSHACTPETHVTDCSNLETPKCRTATSQQSFIYRATKLWNSLPAELKEIKSVKVFKNSLKRTLLENWLNA